MSQPRMGTINGVWQEITWLPIQHNGSICRALIEPWRRANGDLIEAMCSFKAKHGRFCHRHGAALPMLRVLEKLAKKRGIEIVEDSDG